MDKGPGKRSDFPWQRGQEKCNPKPKSSPDCIQLNSKENLRLSPVPLDGRGARSREGRAEPQGAGRSCPARTVHRDAARILLPGLSAAYSFQKGSPIGTGIGLGENCHFMSLKQPLISRTRCQEVKDNKMKARKENDFN